MVGHLFHMALLCGFLPKVSSDMVAAWDSLVAFHQDASFTCTLPWSKGVSQITWQRLAGGSLHDLATYSKRYGQKVREENRERIAFTRASLSSTSITVRNVTAEDEGCYVCTFHVYPGGSQRKQMCITVHGVFGVRAERVAASEEEPNTAGFVCSATGKPAPAVRWTHTSNQQRSEIRHSDGTVSVSVNLTLPVSDKQATCVQCVVNSNMTRSVCVSERSRNSTQDGNSFLPVTVTFCFTAFIITGVIIWVILKRKHRFYKTSVYGSLPDVLHTCPV